MTITTENPRHEAHYIVTGTDQWRAVSALAADRNRELYDRDVHGANLRCTDSHCHEPVRYRRGYSAHGESIDVPAQFYAVDREAHERNKCMWLAPENNRHHNSVTLTEALEGNHAVILNMNFPMGDTREGTFGSPWRSEHIPSSYNDFRNTHKHATIAMHDLAEYFETVQRLPQRDAKIAGRLHVQHCHDIMLQREFSIGADEKKFRDMKRGLQQTRETQNASFRHEDESVGAARHIVFKPAETERAGKRENREQINSAPILYVHGKTTRQNIMLLNTLVLSDASMRDEILRNLKLDVVAVPSLRLSDVFKAQTIFNAGRTGIIPIRWRIASREQFQATEGAPVIPVVGDLGLTG